MGETSSGPAVPRMFEKGEQQRKHVLLVNLHQNLMAHANEYLALYLRIAYPMQRMLGVGEACGTSGYRIIRTGDAENREIRIGTGKQLPGMQFLH